jgi:hypothetical protein
MNWDELKSKIVVQNEIFLLEKGILTPDVDRWLLQFFGGTLTITGASREETETSILITGKVSAYNVENADTRACFSLDASGNVCIVVEIKLDPQTWTFLTSFPNLPGGEYCRLLDIGYSESSLIISNQIVDKYNGISLCEGINFRGIISSSPLMSVIEQKTGVYPVMHGHINLDNTREMKELDWGEFPDDSLDPSGNPLPGYVFTVELLDYNSFSITDVVDFTELGLRMYFPPDGVFVNTNPTYFPRYAFHGKIAVPVIDLKADCWMNYVPDTLEFGLEVNLDDFTPKKLAKITELFGSNDAAAALPEALQSTPTVHLRKFCLDFSLTSGLPHIDAVMVTVDLGDASWGVLDNQLSIGQIKSRFLYIPEQDGRESRFDVYLSGIAKFKDKNVAVRAVKSNGFTIYVDLMDSISISLEEYMKSLQIDVPKVPTSLVINSVSGEISPSNHVQLTARMASEGSEWVIPVGSKELKLSDIAVYCRYDFAGKDKEKGNFAGSVSGTVSFDEFKLNASYDFPGKFAFLMHLPDFSLKEFIGKVFGENDLLPGDFDIALTRSTIMFEKGDNEQFSLGLATLVNEFGFLMFRLERAGGETGFVFGLNIDGKKMSELKGFGFLSLLDGFQLSELVFVASTIDNNNFSFPGTEEFKVPAFKGCEVRLPGSGKIVKGLNFYAKWDLDSSQEQKLLKQLLDIKAAIAMALQISLDGDTRLAASCDATICGHDLEMTFGCVLSKGTIAFYAKGAFDIDIQGTKQTITLELGFNQGGAFGSATVNGGQPIDFKWFKLGNLALQLGVDWEGVPSIGVAGDLTVKDFNSSIAVLFDSTQPEKSMVAGALSDLSMLSLFDVFLEPTSVSKVNNDQSLNDIRDILKDFAITGTNAFDLSIDKKEFFDNIKMDKISEAFAENGVSDIPKDISKVFFSVGEDQNSWFFAVFRNKKVEHYQIKTAKNASGTEVLHVSKEAQLYAVPMATDIGEFHYDEGFSLSGQIQLYKFWVEAQIDIDSTKGLSFDVDMSRIDLLDGMVVVAGIDGTGTKPSPDKGPHLHFDTATDPFAEAQVYISILDIVNACNIQANKKGFSAAFEHDSTLAHLDISTTLSGLEYFDAKIEARILEAKIALPGEAGKYVGDLILNNGASVLVSLSIEELNHVTFEAKIGMRLLGKDYALKVDVSFDLKTVAEIIWDMIKRLAKQIADEILDDAKKFAALVLQGIIKGFESAEEALEKVFGIIGDAAKKLLEEANKIIHDVCAVTTAADKLSCDYDE